MIEVSRFGFRYICCLLRQRSRRYSVRFQQVNGPCHISSALLLGVGFSLTVNITIIVGRLFTQVYVCIGAAAD